MKNIFLFKSLKYNFTKNEIIIILLSLSSVYGINQTNFKSSKHNSSDNSNLFEQDIDLVFMKI